MDFEDFRSYYELDNDVQAEDLDIPDCFLQLSIGSEILTYIKSLRAENLVVQIDMEMVKLFNELVHILEDETLDDPSCFHRIDAIVQAFKQRGINLCRNDW